VSAHMAHRAPQLFHAYIGFGQVTNQLESEIISYDYVFGEAKKRNDSVGIQELSGIGRPPYGSEEEAINALDVERYYLELYGKPSPFSKSKLIKLLLFNKGLTMKEKIKFFSGDISHSFTLLWPAALQANLFEDIPSWEIPVYILQGEDDHQTESSVTKRYFDSLKAPFKKYYPFKNTGHAVSWEQPERYRSILKNEVLNN